MNSLESLLETLGATTDLGHAKRDAAFLRLVGELAHHPGGTGAGASTDLATIASAYRFAGNEAVALPPLRRARREAALRACRPEETLLVINDVSVLDYCRHHSKTDRRRVGDGQGKGYEYVCNLGVTLESERVLGVLHDSLISATGPDDTEEVHYHDDTLLAALSRRDPERLACNHKHMATQHVKHLSTVLPGRHFVAVADREFDDHFLFEACHDQGQDFVIRSNAARNVQVAEHLTWLPATAHTAKLPGLPLLPGHVCAQLSTLVEHVPLTPFKSLPLDAGGRLTDPGSAKSYAHVSVGVFPVVLYRRIKRNQQSFTPRTPIALNVVVVKETAPPPDREPILWVLFTSLPAATLADLQRVVRIYELRWRIECFFKYLKSGFGLEALRYDHAVKTARYLVACTLAATFLLNLKQSLGLPAAAILPPADYARTKRAAQHPDDPALPVPTRIFALLATSGGWRGRRRDPITPLTLMRGVHALVTAVELLEAAPELLRTVAARWRRSKTCV